MNDQTVSYIIDADDLKRRMKEEGLIDAVARTVRDVLTSSFHYPSHAVLLNESSVVFPLKMAVQTLCRYADVNISLLSRLSSLYTTSQRLLHRSQRETPSSLTMPQVSVSMTCLASWPPSNRLRSTARPSWLRRFRCTRSTRSVLFETYRHQQTRRISKRRWVF